MASQSAASSVGNEILAVEVSPVTMTALEWFEPWLQFNFHYINVEYVWPSLTTRLHRAVQKFQNIACLVPSSKQ